MQQDDCIFASLRTTTTCIGFHRLWRTIVAGKNCPCSNGVVVQPMSLFVFSCSFHISSTRLDCCCAAREWGRAHRSMSHNEQGLLSCALFCGIGGALLSRNTLVTRKGCPHRSAAARPRSAPATKVHSTRFNSAQLFYSGYNRPVSRVVL